MMFVGCATKNKKLEITSHPSQLLLYYLVGRTIMTGQSLLFPASTLLLALQDWWCHLRQLQ